MNVMDFHPIANVFPMLSDAELEELTVDIQLNGQIRPIIVFEDQILDGRNRYLACRKAKVEPQLSTFVGDWPAAVRFALSENLRRRHLSESQRALAAAKLARLKPGRPPEANKTAEISAINSPAVTQAEAARQLKISPDSVQFARHVQDKGVPELVKAVEADEIKVSAARELSRLPEDQQREVLAGGKKKVAETVKELRAARPKRQPTDNEQKLRASRDAGMIVDQLSLTVVQLKQAVQAISTVEMTDYVRESTTGYVSELHTIAGWLETIIAGEGVPDSVPTSWLEDGRNQ